MVTSAFSSTLVHLSVMMMITASRLGILLYMMIQLKLKNLQTKAGFIESNHHSFSLILLKMVSFYFVFCFFSHFRIGSHRLPVMSTDLNSHREYNGLMSLRYICHLYIFKKSSFAHLLYSGIASLALLLFIVLQK